jgi:hypothetical protein
VELLDIPDVAALVSQRLAGPCGLSIAERQVEAAEPERRDIAAVSA